MIRGRVPIGIDEHGEPIMKQIKAKNEYELMIRAGKMMLASGMLDGCKPPTRKEQRISPTFSEFAERWYKIYKADNPNLRPATKSDYRRSLDRIIFPAIGNRRMDEITATDLQELLNQNSGIASSTQTKVITTLRQIFEMAVQENCIVKNPAKVKLAKTGKEKKDGRSLSQREWLAVQSSLGSMCEADRVFIALILYEGLRRGEALGLTWENVDFEKNRIHVAQQAAYNNGSNTPAIQPPKTKSSIRDVPLVKPLRGTYCKTSRPKEGMSLATETPLTQNPRSQRHGGESRKQRELPICIRICSATAMRRYCMNWA